MSPNVEDELFCDGISEEIIKVLSRVPKAFVTSRTSSFHFKHQDLEITAIAEQLGVKYIVEGSLRRSGNMVRITVQIINAEDDYHYWAENFDRRYENIFQIQDEIAIEVKEKFRELIGHFEFEPETDQQFSKRSVDAYEFIQKAHSIATDLSEENVSQGLKLIDKALEIEPDNPTHHATKATYTMTLGFMGAIPLNNAVVLAETSCNKALEMNPNDAEANAIKGYMHFIRDGDVPTFTKYNNKALNIQPKLTFALYFKSIVASALGDYEVSMDCLDIVTDINPLSLVPGYLKSANLLRLERYDQALEEVDILLSNHPDHLNAYNIKGYTYLRLGKHKLALAHFAKMPTKDGKVPYYGAMAIAFALLGNISEAEHHLSESLKHDHLLHLQYKENPLVMVNFLIGKFEDGFEALKSDIENNAWYLRFYRSNPFLEPIAQDSRAVVLEKMLILPNLKEQVNEGQKYAKTGLSEKEVTQYAKELSEYMRSDRPFLDPKLSLKQLADKLNLSANQLSQVINSQKNKNFFDYVNSYRIREVISRLNEDKNKQYTILSLALDAGFNSKSAFNASFKKLTGLTPSEYLKSLDT